MTWLILLLVAVVVVVLVVRNNKKEAEMFAGKIKSVADVNHDGKVDLQDAKVVAEKVTTETKQVVAKVKKATVRKKKNS